MTIVPLKYKKWNNILICKQFGIAKILAISHIFNIYLGKSETGSD